MISSMKSVSLSTWAKPCPKRRNSTSFKVAAFTIRMYIQEVSVQLFGTTAILLNKIRLVAVVGGNEVTNPFVVTEVYIQESDIWILASLSFTRLLTPS